MIRTSVQLREDISEAFLLHMGGRRNGHESEMLTYAVLAVLASENPKEFDKITKTQRRLTEKLLFDLVRENYYEKRGDRHGKSVGV